jgi:hypothetical protein
MTRRAAVVKPIRQFDRELRDGDLLDVKLLDGTTSLRRLRKSQHGLKLVCEAGTAADYDGAIILGVVVGELTEYVRDGGSSN